MEKKRAKIFLVTAMLVLMLLAVSCSEQVPSQLLPDPNGNGDEIAPDGTVQVSLVVEEDKSLSSAINRDIEYWEFMATPKFEMAEGEKLWGQVSYWRVLPEMNTANSGVKTTANLGKYTSGDWYFEVRALNDQKHVIYVGSTQQVVRQGLNNTVHITMLTDRADGTHGESADATSTYTGATGDKSTGTETISEYGSLHVGIDFNKLDLSPANIEIFTYRQKVGKGAVLGASEKVEGISWTKRGAGEKYTNWYVDANTDNYRTISGDNSKSIGEGRAYYECVINNLSAGPYVYTFYVMAKNTANVMIPIAGQAVNVMIMGNEETQVKGTLLANEYVLSRLTIDDPGRLYFSINGENHKVVNAGSSATLTFQQTTDQRDSSKEAPVRYFWIVNGNYVSQDGQTTPSLEFSCPLNEKGTPAYGIHRVALVAFGEQGSVGTSTIDVIFNPTSGPGEWDDFDWPDYITNPGGGN